MTDGLRGAVRDTLATVEAVWQQRARDDVETGVNGWPTQRAIADRAPASDANATDHLRALDGQHIERAETIVLNRDKQAANAMSIAPADAVGDNDPTPVRRAP